MKTLQSMRINSALVEFRHIICRVADPQPAVAMLENMLKIANTNNQATHLLGAKADSNVEAIRCILCNLPGIREKPLEFEKRS